MSLEASSPPGVGIVVEMNEDGGLGIVEQGAGVGASEFGGHFGLVQEGAGKRSRHIGAAVIVDGDGAVMDGDELRLAVEVVESVGQGAGRHGESGERGWAPHSRSWKRQGTRRRGEPGRRGRAGRRQGRTTGPQGMKLGGSLAAESRGRKWLGVLGWVRQY